MTSSLLTAFRGQRAAADSAITGLWQGPGALQITQGLMIHKSSCSRYADVLVYQLSVSCFCVFYLAIGVSNFLDQCYASGAVCYLGQRSRRRRLLRL